MRRSRLGSARHLSCPRLPPSVHCRGHGLSNGLSLSSTSLVNPKNDDFALNVDDVDVGVIVAFTVEVVHRSPAIAGIATLEVSVIVVAPTVVAAARAAATVITPTVAVPAAAAAAVAVVASTSGS